MLGSRIDFGSNILLTIGIGFFAMGWLWPDRGGPRAAALTLLVFAGSILFSTLVEFSQVFIEARNPAVSDIVAHGIGAGVGIAMWWLWGRTLWHRLLNAKAAHAPLERSERYLWIYLLVLFGYSLTPLDVTLNPADLYAKWKLGRIELLPFSWSYGGPIDALYALATDILVWVPVGLLRGLSSRGTPWRTLPWCALAVVILECSQLLIMSRVTSSTDILTGVLGAGAGALLAARITRGVHAPATPPQPSAPAASGRVAATAVPQHADDGRRRSTGRWGLASACAWFVLLLSVFWYPYNFQFERAAIAAAAQRFFEIPLNTLQRGSELGAITAVLNKTLFLMPLGVAFCVMLRSWRGHGLDALVALLALAFGAAAGLVIELGQLALPGKAPSSSDVLLMAAGSAVGYFGYLRIARMLPGDAGAARRRSTFHSGSER